MNNLFRIFDASTSDLLSLNWFLLGVVFILLPKSFHLREGRLRLIVSNLLGFLKQDFSMAIGVAPRTTLIPLLCSIFILILVVNFIGLMPYVFTCSRNLSFTLRISLVLWLSIQIGFILNCLNHLLAHLVPLGTPRVLVPFIVYIELIRATIRPLTLAVRLAANMVAGHLLICLVNGASYNSPIIVGVLLGGITLMILELGVVFIQAYVFRTLSRLYYAELNENLKF